MADARIDTVCGLVAAAITDGLAPGDTTAVVDDDPAPELFDREDSAKLTGRTVYVLPATYSQEAQLSRTVQENAYRVSVLIVTPYPTAGRPAHAWVKAERGWVESQVYDRLNPSRKADNPLAPQGYWCETAEVVEVTAIDLLRGDKLFWSQADFEFRKHE